MVIQTKIRSIIIIQFLCITGALQDLNKAIEVGQSQGSQSAAVCQAFTQRGLIQKLEGKTKIAHGLREFRNNTKMYNKL